jgi:hypothetical protein
MLKMCGGAELGRTPWYTGAVSGVSAVSGESHYRGTLAPRNALTSIDCHDRVPLQFLFLSSTDNREGRTSVSPTHQIRSWGMLVYVVYQVWIW